jgi:hypothetical protein
VVLSEPSWVYRLSEVLPMALILLSPAALAAWGRWREPGAMVAAAVAGLPLSLVSLGGAGLPYLIPTILFFVAAARDGGPRARQVVLSVVIAGLLVASFIVMIVGFDQVCWTVERTGSGKTQTSVTRTPSAEGGSITMGRNEVSAGCTQVPANLNGAASTALATLAIFGGSAALRRAGREAR